MGQAAAGASLYERAIYPLLARADAERVHERTLLLLRLAQTSPVMRLLLRRLSAVADPRLETRAFDLHFANPVGLAAGFDKNGVAVAGLAALGFGHVEVGTVTPRPQPGRSRPRLFRLTEDDALINRLGFPSQGSAAVAGRLAHPGLRRCVLGVNVGPNASSVAAGTATRDYVAACAALAPYADYLAVNVSSPNTQGLRALQAEAALDDLLDALFAAGGWARRPLLLKIAPDLDDDALARLLHVATAYPVAGVIATNTTLARPESLRGAARAEAGGLSGAPLRDRSTAVIRQVYHLTEGRLPIIGVGGVRCAADALAKLRAGATLVQLYTGLVYAGPLVARQINLGLLAALEHSGCTAVAALVGQG